MKNAISFLALVTLLSVAHAVYGAHNPVIFSQDPLPDPGGGVPIAALSQNDTSLNGFGEIGRAYDNFWFGSNGALVTDIHWRGAYDMDPAPDNFVDSFVITIWADVAGEPGTGLGDILSAQTVPSIETFVAIETGLSGDDVYVYDYDADFAVPFVADPVTDYWVSIMANLSTSSFTDPFHGWHFALAGSGDGLFVQDFDLGPFNGIVDPGEGRLLGDGDLSFRLTGVVPGVIPEPSSVCVWLVLGTVVGLGMMGRRRRVRAN